MDLSKLKIELYDFLALILPGLLVIFEGWIALQGWPSLAMWLGNLSGTTLTLLLIVSFGLGNIVQELADVLIKGMKDPRYFCRSRDIFWASDEANAVRDAIANELGKEISSADAAFDYCLTKIQGLFPKRDVFLATSDLCRSLLILVLVGIAPVARLVLESRYTTQGMLGSSAAGLGILLLVGYLSWTRMVRFRDLSEVTVFRIYLASTIEDRRQRAQR